MTTKQTQPVNFDPQSLAKDALGGVGSAEVRARITAVVAGALLRDGIATMKGRHAVDDIGLGAQIWPTVRAAACLSDGTTVEQTLRRWPAAGSATMALGHLCRVLLTASNRRAALEQELRALDALGAIEQRHEPSPLIALRAKLALQFPAADYDPTGATR